ncbi:MAG: flavodoxin family protein [Nitrospinales bacterium]
MSSAKQIVGLVGSYRKGGYIDSTVEETLSAARTQGAKTEKIFLLDEHIEFCGNCRTCMQEPGFERGKCVVDDGMEKILQKIDEADSIVIGSPVNCGDVTALTRKFYERSVGYSFWPRGAKMPRIRSKKRTKKAVLISSSSAPGWFSRLFCHAMGTLKGMAKLFGAKPVGTLFIGFADQEVVQLPKEIKYKAKLLGEKLVI